MSKELTNEIMENMEFLIEELHKEWEKSGVTTAAAIIGIKEVKDVNKKLQEKIAKKQTILEKDTITFREGIHFTKENYALYRLVRKIKDNEDMANDKGIDSELVVSLDTEEFELYKSMFEPKLSK